MDGVKCYFISILDYDDLKWFLELKMNFSVFYVIKSIIIILRKKCCYQKHLYHKIL